VGQVQECVDGQGGGTVRHTREVLVELRVRIFVLLMCVWGGKPHLLVTCTTRAEVSRPCQLLEGPELRARPLT
jgi:hypothetical protein